MALFDRVILSSNDHPDYLPYWPYVAKAYKKFFNAKATLALVGNYRLDCDLVKRLREHGDVIPIDLEKKIPIHNQAKLARHYVSTLYQREVCVINDIDLLPLCSHYLTNLLKQRPKNHLMCIGADVYKNTDHEGKFPIGYLTAESYILKELFNPKTLNYYDWIRSFVGTKVFDNKECPMNAKPVSDWNCFSDESLIRVLISRWSKKETHVKYLPRGFEVRIESLDRSTWTIEEGVLNKGGYIEAHLPRPYHAYKDDIETLSRYIDTCTTG